MRKVKEIDEEIKQVLIRQDLNKTEEAKTLSKLRQERSDALNHV